MDKNPSDKQHQHATIALAKLKQGFCRKIKALNVIIKEKKNPNRQEVLNFFKNNELT